jgi:hypothetical protein
MGLRPNRLKFDTKKKKKKNADDRNHGEQHSALQIIYTVKLRPSAGDGDTHKIQRSSSDRECER